jgi:hypothetical protein
MLALVSFLVQLRMRQLQEYFCVLLTPSLLSVFTINPELLASFKWHAAPECVFALTKPWMFHWSRDELTISTVVTRRGGGRAERELLSVMRGSKIKVPSLDSSFRCCLSFSFSLYCIIDRRADNIPTPFIHMHADRKRERESESAERERERKRGRQTACNFVSFLPQSFSLKAPVAESCLIGSS